MLEKQAFDQGFIEECQRLGLTHPTQVQNLYKVACLQKQALDPSMAALLGAGAGGLGGAGLGALLAPKKRGMGALLGGLGGAGLGAGAGFGLNELLAAAGSPDVSGDTSGAAPGLGLGRQVGGAVQSGAEATQLDQLKKQLEALQGLGYSNV